jgi:hypothetical protein
MMFRVRQKCPSFSTPGLAGIVLHSACDTGQAEKFVISRQLTGQKQQVHGRAHFWIASPFQSPTVQQRQTA